MPQFVSSREATPFRGSLSKFGEPLTRPGQPVWPEPMKSSQRSSARLWLVQKSSGIARRWRTLPSRRPRKETTGGGGFFFWPSLGPECGEGAAKFDATRRRPDRAVPTTPRWHISRLENDFDGASRRRGFGWLPLNESRAGVNEKTHTRTERRNEKPRERGGHFGRSAAVVTVSKREFESQLRDQSHRNGHQRETENSTNGHAPSTRRGSLAGE